MSGSWRQPSQLLVIFPKVALATITQHHSSAAQPGPSGARFPWFLSTLLCDLSRHLSFSSFHFFARHGEKGLHNHTHWNCSGLLNLETVAHTRPWRRVDADASEHVLCSTLGWVRDKHRGCLSEVDGLTCAHLPSGVMHQFSIDSHTPQAEQKQDSGPGQDPRGPLLGKALAL